MARIWLRGWAVTLVVLTALGAAAALAEGVGSPAVVVSSASGYAEYPALAVDARGDQTVTWTNYLATDPARFPVLTATRLAGSGSWSVPVRISGVSDGQDGPRLALAPSGAGVIVWAGTVDQGRRSVLQAVTRPSASAAWTQPVRISAPGADVYQFALGIDSAGEATIVWNDGFATNPPIDSDTVSVASGRWGVARQLVEAGQGGLAQVAVNPGGEALLTWQRQVSRTIRPNSAPTLHYEQMAAYRPAAGFWQPPVAIGGLSEPELQPGGNIWAPSTPTLALDDRGGATVIWQSIRGKGQVLDVSHRPASAATWKPAVSLATNAVAPVIATDANGDLTVVWTNQHGRILHTESSNGTQWSQPAAVPGSNAFVTWLSVGARGNAILTWSAAHSRVLLATRGADGARWTRPVTVGRGYFPQAALDRGGNASVVWPRLLPQPKFGAVIDTTTRPTG